MTDLIPLLRERAEGYGALRKSSLTAIALDRAADEIAALMARVAELEEALTEAHDQLWHLAKDPSSNPLVLQLSAILSKQEPEYSGWVEVVNEGESARAAIAAIGGDRG